MLAQAASVAPKDWKKTNEENSAVDPLHKEDEVCRCCLCGCVFKGGLKKFNYQINCS